MRSNLKNLLKKSEMGNLKNKNLKTGIKPVFKLKKLSTVFFTCLLLNGIIKAINNFLNYK